MILRVTKISLILAIAVFYTFIIFNNLTDYNTRHILMMDSTSAGNHGMWRALNRPAWHTAFYIAIISWESVVMLLCWGGGWRLIRQFSSPAATFEDAKRVSIAALTLALLMWIFAFCRSAGSGSLCGSRKPARGRMPPSACLP